MKICMVFLLSLVICILRVPHGAMSVEVPMIMLSPQVFKTSEEFLGMEMGGQEEYKVS